MKCKNPECDKDINPITERGGNRKYCNKYCREWIHRIPAPKSNNKIRRAILVDTCPKCLVDVVINHGGKIVCKKCGRKL